MSRQYKKGRLFEYSVRDLLVSAGFDVTRSAGSRGLKDLVAVKNGNIYYIQCKYNQSDAEKFITDKYNDIVSICKKYKVNFVVAYRPAPRKHKIKFIVFTENKFNVLQDFDKLELENVEVI